MTAREMGGRYRAGDLENTKVSRESLYRALSRNGNPELSTIIGVLHACGITLAAKAA